DDIRRPGLDKLQVGGELLVVRDLAEARLLIVFHPCLATTHGNLRFTAGESRDLPLPLMLERGRTHNERPLHTEVPRKQLRGGDGLDGLAQSHLISNKATPGAHCE